MMNMTQYRMKIYLIILCYLLDCAFGGSNERHLLRHLFVTQQHNPLERPAKHDSESVSVSLQFSLIRILDVDETNQVFIGQYWITQIWEDYSMIWDPEDYGNIQALSIPSTKIWTPDINLYNRADEEIDNIKIPNVVINHTGQILLVTPRIFKSTCEFHTTFLPSDIQHCYLKFGSWTYDKSKVNLTKPYDELDVTSYINNTKWDLKSTSVVKAEEKYDCCPEIYQSIKVTIKFRRRSI